MKKISLTIVAALLMTACTKYFQNYPVDPPMVNSLTGKWAFYSSYGIYIPQDAITNHFIDTLIYNEDYSYILIDNKDTIDKGSFSIGYGEATNGFGIKQGYDSILFKSSSVVLDPVYPAVRYVKQLSLDTLSMGNYYKDSSLAKAIVNYVKVK